MRHVRGHIIHKEYSLGHKKRQTGGGRTPPHWPRSDVELKNRRAFSSVLIIRRSCQKSKCLVYFTKICYTMKGGKDAFSLGCETGRGPCTAYISGRPRVEGRRAAYFSFQVELHLHTLHGGGKAGSCVIGQGVAPLLIASHNRNRFMAGLIHNAAFTRAGLQRRRDEAGAQRVRAEV